MIGLYAIVHAPTNKAYVGSSKDIQKRLACHASFLRRGKHHCAHLQNAYRLYGQSAFTFKVLATCDTRDEAQELEQAVLDIWYGGLYNASKRADHLHRLGRPLPEEVKAKIGAKNSGAIRSVEQRQKIAQSLKDRYASGMVSPQRGKKHTEETKAKIKAKRALQGATNRGYVASAQTRQKQALAKIGNRCHAKTVCTDVACFFGLDTAAKHYGVSAPTFRKMMARNGWGFV